jgi:hypothetical protein
VLVGAVVAYVLAAQVQVAVLLAFAAGNFLYIALADLVPELTTIPPPMTRLSTPSGLPSACCCSWSPCSTEAPALQGVQRAWAP